jgi:hypothetical protein
MMKNFIDQSHGIDLPGLNSGFGKCCKVALLVHPAGKDAGGMEIREDRIPTIGKKFFVELIPVAAGAGYMKFHVEQTSQGGQEWNNYTGFRILSLPRAFS